MSNVIELYFVQTSQRRYQSRSLVVCLLRGLDLLSKPFVHHCASLCVCKVHLQGASARCIYKVRVYTPPLAQNYKQYTYRLGDLLSRRAHTHVAQTHQTAVSCCAMFNDI